MIIPNDTIVMVADGEKCLLFRNEGDEKYPVLETLSHEESRSPATREAGSDMPGRTASSIGDRHSSYGNTDWHEQKLERFAVHAAQVLEVTATAMDVGIVVLAPPRTLGVLRKH